METDISILLITAISVGIVHTILGPDHYLPFVVMAKARSWKMAKTMWITLLCGMGHVLSSILIGAFGIAMGLGVSKLEHIEAFRGDIAAWVLFFFGIVYLLWGLWRIYHRKSHIHAHSHKHGVVHTHEHTHEEAHNHTHKMDKAATLSPWILFVVFVLGPCEALIPILMYPAAKLSTMGVTLVSLVFSIATIATMMLATALLLYGVRFVKLNVIDKYTHAIAGATIAVSAGAILFLGL